FFQAEDGIRDKLVTGVQTCALPIFMRRPDSPRPSLSPADLHDLSATTDERRESGRLARRRAPRATLGHWEEDQRGHDALKTIQRSEERRVGKEGRAGWWRGGWRTEM